MELHFTNLLIVVAAGFGAPFALGFLPKLRLTPQATPAH